MYDQFYYENGQLFYKKTNKRAGRQIKTYWFVSIKSIEKPEHRIIWEMFYGKIPDNLQIDHIDRNGLNNKIENLRLATSQENNRNLSKRKNKCYSKYKGVSWNKKLKKWTSYINYNKNKIFLGYFNKEIEAALAYNKTATLLFKNFVVMNEVYGVTVEEV